MRDRGRANRSRRCEFIIASYNIHGCVGADGATRPERVARVLRQLDADVIGLQEVNCRPPHLDGTDQLTQLARWTGMQALPGPTIREQQGYYGNALLTRHSVVEVIQTDLSVGRREPRGIMDVRLQVGRLVLRVLVTHFGLKARERRRQVDMVLDLVHQRDANRAAVASPFDVLVLLGDFNEWHPGGISLVRLHESFGRPPPIRTFPSRWPFLALDRIWCKPHEAITEVGTLKNRWTRIASDHLPLWARLDLSLRPAAASQQPTP